MEKEQSLQHKISKLQLQLLDFHNRISPTKGESGKRAVESTASQQDQPATECHQVKTSKLFSILKPFICVLGPFLFPTLVYSIEGCCPLFWLSTAVSSFVTFFLLLMVFSLLSYKMQEVMHNGRRALRGAQTKVRIAVQDVDQMGSERKYQNTSLVLLLMLISASGYWALLSDMSTMLNVCLVAYGYIAGILSVNLYAFWKQPKRLPYVSPITLKRNLEKETSPSSKRGLNFYEMQNKCSPLLSPKDCYRPLSEESSTCTKLQAMAHKPSHQEAASNIYKNPLGQFSLF